uniref:Calpain-13 n=1 Tax=Anthurium amnicola TaxID=1678845 RepID=A0A1D1ZJ75_9ARAE
MGQVITTIQDKFQEKFQGKEWRKRQIRKITNKVFDKFKDDCGKDHLSFENVYIAVLYIYNDINKHLPGPHNDPPSKAKLKTMMEEYDVNLDGLLDREEFAEFIQKLTADTLTAVSRNLIIALVVAPTMALIAKRATEGVPRVGSVVQRIPNSIYATVVTLAVVLLQNSSEDFE